MFRLLRSLALISLGALCLSAAALASSTATIFVVGAETKSFDQSWDVGPVQISFNGFTETIYYGQFSSPASVASSIAGQFTRDYLKDGLCANASGSNVTFKLKGSATFGTLSITEPNTSFFINSAGFAATSSPGTTLGTNIYTVTSTMTGGWDAGTFYDSGTAQVTVSGATAEADWDEGTTPAMLASNLASAINSAAGGFVSASPLPPSGNTAQITVTSLTDGPSADVSIYGGTTETNTDYFTAPSFTITTQNMSGGSFSGGSPLYSYVIPDQGGYDLNGNLLTVNDSIMGQWAYSYDNLNRLLTAGAPVSQPTGMNAYYAGVQTSWGYDAFGNRLSETQGALSGATPTASMPPSSTSTYTTTGNQLATSTMASAITYDAAGDITYDGSNYYLYDAEGRICAVKNSNSVLTGYVYDAAGIRVAKGALTRFTCDFNSADTSTYNGFTTTTSWVLGPGGEQVTEYAVTGSTSTWQHTNAFASGSLLATYHDTDTYFALNDWLGTKRMEISAGGLSATYRSLAYGNGEVSTGTAVDATEHHFTGKERDAESGNDYFEARYYSSNLGRFMSPDWSAKAEPVPYAKLDDPQSLNLYGYVRNNPMIRVDADGHDCTGFCKTMNDAFNKLHEIVQPLTITLKAPAAPAPPPASIMVHMNGHKVSNERVSGALPAVASYLGGDVSVTSGDRDFRPQGSPPRSEHLFKDAVDFHVGGMSDHDVKEALKAPDSPVSHGFDVIEHGPHTGTEGPHVHLDGRVGKGIDPSSRSTFMHEGITPQGKNIYTPEKVDQ